MNVEVLQIISIVAFSMSAVFSLIAVILFFKLDVRAIVDDLTGKKAERQIRELREQNRQPEINRNGRILYNVPSERTTAKLPFVKKEDKTAQLQEDTTVLHDDAESTTLLSEIEKTYLLSESEEEESTTVLVDEETMVLDEEGTTVLKEPEKVLQNGYRLLIDEMIIHIEERI